MVSKSIIFLVNSFLDKFYRHMAIFSGHTEPRSRGAGANHSVNCTTTTGPWRTIVAGDEQLYLPQW